MVASVRHRQGRGAMSDTQGLGRTGSDAGKPMIGIYDFSYGPYALGDALTWTMNLNVGAAWLWGLGGWVPPDPLRRSLRCRGEHPPGYVEPDAGEPVSRFAAAGMARLHPSRDRTPPRRAVSHPGRVHGVGPRGVSSAQR